MQALLPVATYGPIMASRASGEGPQRMRRSEQPADNPIEAVFPQELKARGYMAKELVLCTLPHRDPGPVAAWSRTNGRFTLGIQPGYDYHLKQAIGLPYGSIPRLLLFWLTSEAVRTNSRRIELGETLNAFMRDVGLDPNTGGGKRGDAKRLRDQIRRLFNARISFTTREGNAQAGHEARVNMEVAAKYDLWWDYTHPDQTSFFASYLELGEGFFEAITATPVPLDTRALRALKRSPMALDLYAWAAYRAYTLHHTTEKRALIPYQALKWQFGAEYNRRDHFKAALKEALDKVAQVYPALRYEFGPIGLAIAASPPSVPPAAKKLLRTTYRDNPLFVSRETRARASAMVTTWDSEKLLQTWREWATGRGEEIRDPDAHFLTFLKTHIAKNGR